MKAFWYRFWNDFRRPGNVKNEGFVWEGRIFLRFRALQDEMRFGSSFGGVLGRFLEVVWASLGGFGRFGRGLKNNKNSKPKLLAKKKGAADSQGFAPAAGPLFRHSGIESLDHMVISIIDYSFV